MGSERLGDLPKTAQPVSGNRRDLNTDLLHSVGKNLSLSLKLGFCI